MNTEIKQDRIVFVSGHLDLTKEEFEQHYVPELHHLVREGCLFVVGDARGCDLFVQEWFDYCFIFGGAPLTVYHMLEKPRDHGFPTEEVYPLVGGFQNDEERDAAMTAASTEDLAWVKPGRQKSGIAKNLLRRNEQVIKKNNDMEK